jgi:hypothetical protein
VRVAVVGDDAACPGAARRARRRAPWATRRASSRPADRGGERLLVVLVAAGDELRANGVAGRGARRWRRERFGVRRGGGRRGIGARGRDVDGRRSRRWPRPPGYRPARASRRRGGALLWRRRSSPRGARERRRARDAA